MEEKDTELQIKEAARTVFMKRGYAGARMQEIADLAGINKALLHYYYRSKERLYDVIFMEVFQELMEGLESAFVEEDSIKVKMEAFIDLYISTLMKNPHMPLFVVSEISRDPDTFIEKLKTKEIFEGANKIVLSFISDLNNEYGEQLNAIHLFMNIISMCVFPFISKPMLGAITQIDDATWKILMETRKEEVKRFVAKALEKR